MANKDSEHENNFDQTIRVELPINRSTKPIFTPLIQEPALPPKIQQPEVISPQISPSKPPLPGADDFSVLAPIAPVDPDSLKPLNVSNPTENSNDFGQTIRMDLPKSVATPKNKAHESTLPPKIQSFSNIGGIKPMSPIEPAPSVNSRGSGFDQTILLDPASTRIKSANNILPPKLHSNAPVLPPPIQVNQNPLVPPGSGEVENTKINFDQTIQLGMGVNAPKPAFPVVENKAGAAISPGPGFPKSSPAVPMGIPSAPPTPILSAAPAAKPFLVKPMVPGSGDTGISFQQKITSKPNIGSIPPAAPVAPLANPFVATAKPMITPASPQPQRIISSAPKPQAKWEPEFNPSVQNIAKSAGAGATQKISLAALNLASKSSQKLESSGIKSASSIAGIAPAKAILANTQSTSGTRRLCELLGLPETMSLNLEDAVGWVAQLEGVEGVVFVTLNEILMNGQVPETFDIPYLSAIRRELFRPVEQYAQQFEIGEAKQAVLVSDQRMVACFKARDNVLVVIHTPDFFSMGLMEHLSEIALELSHIV